MPLQLYEKEKILDACFEVFAVHGYAKTSTAMLAEAAGISKALIFHHFGSKKELYVSVLERSFNTMASELHREPPAEDGDFFEAKEQNGVETIGYLRKNPRLNRVFFEAFYSTPDELKSEIHQFRSRMEEQYGEISTERESQMMKLFNRIPLRAGVDSQEAYELIQVVSEYFRMKLAKELTDSEKVNDDGYWENFFEKKNSFLDMVRFGIEAHT